MKKYIKIICMVFILFVGVVILAGCSKKASIDSGVVGNWKYDEDGILAIYIFNKDGTGSYTITVEENTVVKDLDYYTKDGKLFINYDKDPDTFELEYKLKNGNLLVYDSLGEELIYKKVK